MTPFPEIEASIRVVVTDQPSVVRMIVDIVADYHGITRQELLSDRRHARLTLPRKIAYWLAHELTGKTDEQIATAMRRERSTVAQGRKDVDGWIQDERWAGKTALLLRGEIAR